MQLCLTFDEDDRPIITKRWRDPKTQERQTSTHTGFVPYFYVSEREDPLLYGHETKDCPDAITMSHGGLKKVIGTTPSQISRMREAYITTYEADIPFLDRFAIDTMDYSDFIDYEPRKAFIDIEAYVERGNPTPTYITAITVWDSYENQYNTWALKSQSDASFPSSLVQSFDDERSLIESFLSFWESCDFDMIVAWGLNFFDIPHLISRCKANEVDYRRLSPVNRVSKPRPVRGMVGNTDQPIHGIMHIDLGWCFRRIYQQSGHSGLTSGKLDDVSKMLYGEGKAEIDLYTGWKDDWLNYIAYNVRDVELMVRIDSDWGITGLYFQLQRMVGLSFGSIFFGKNLCKGLFMREAWWKAPTSRVIPKADRRESLTAAIIAGGKNDDIEHLDIGRHENVAILDFKSLYPSIIQRANLSWETRRSNHPAFDAGNGTLWDTRNEGILPRIIRRFNERRDELKQQAKEGDTAAAEQQIVVKVITNTFYGLMGHSGFAWASMDIARTITHMARETLKYAIGQANEMGYTVLYYHTDSIFIKCDTPCEALELSTILTAKCREHFNTEFVTLDYEAWTKHFLLKGTNRYAMQVEHPKSYFKHTFEAKAANASPLTKTTQLKVLKMICNGDDEESVSTYLRQIIADIKNMDDEKWHIVSNGTRISKNPEDYAQPSGSSRAALYYNKNINPDEPFVKGETVYWTYVIHNETDIIAFRTHRDVADYDLDYDTVITKQIISKVEDIYAALGWDIEFVKTGFKQRGFEFDEYYE